MNTKQYFIENQRDMLRLFNTDGGRFLLGVDKNPIVKITPNSVHQLMDFRNGKPIIFAKFYTREVFSKFIPTFDQLAILKDEWREHDPYKAFLNYSGLERYKNLPQIYLTTTNYYTTAGDGWILSFHGTWATARSGSSLSATPSAGTAKVFAEYADAFYMGRMWMPTDTSGLTADATVTAADFHLYVTIEQHAIACAIGLVLGTQASYATLATTDWGSIGSTEGATRKNSTFSLGDLNFSLNATGLSWIQQTGTTDFAFRAGRDIDNSAPAASSALTETTVTTGEAASNDPYLAVTYTLPAAGGGNFFLGA